MPRISDYIQAPYQGVSQAAQQVRLAEQAQSILNASLNVPQGAEKRPPFEFLCKLADHPGDASGLFELVSQGGQEYALTLTVEAGVAVPRLYPISGLPMAYSDAGLPSESITIEAQAQSYLSAGTPSPSLDIASLTVEDYTFLLNRKRVVGKIAGTTPGRPFEAILWTRAGAYGRTYTVTVTPNSGAPVAVTLHTPNGKDAADADWVDTGVITGGLHSGTYTYTANGASITGALTDLIAQGFTVAQTPSRGSQIYLAHPTMDFTVAVTDGQGGEALTVIKDRAQAFSDLPRKAVDGFVVRLTQQSASDRDDFFVTYDETAGAGTGVWQETIGPNSERGLDPVTMPVGLVNEAGVWSLKVLQWEGRLVGNQELSPDPDFVGRTLSDICFWKERLGLVSSEGITLSSANDPFKMYPTTLATVIASDAVSLFNPFDQQAQFAYAIPFDRKLILWGKKAQAQVTSEGPFTPDSADIDEFSTYEYSTAASPQGSNNRLYFPAPRGPNYSAVYEMDINQTTSTVEGDDLTVSVPRYVPAAVDRIASCPVNYQMVYGRSGDSILTTHLFRYSEKQRVQNAWSQWALPAGYTYGGGFFVNTSFYCILCRDGEGFLARIDTAPGSLDADPLATILTHLDMRASEGQVGVSYSADLDQTTLTLPYPITAPVSVLVRAPGGQAGVSSYSGFLATPLEIEVVGDFVLAFADGSPLAVTGGPLLTLAEGASADILSQGGNSVVLEGDWTNVGFFVGIPYEKAIELSKIYARDGDGNPLRSGRLSLRKLILDLEKTAYLRVRVTVGGRAPKVYTFEGGFINDPETQTDKMLLYSGPWDVPVKGTNEDVKIEVLNDSPFPSALLGYTWEGELNLRAGRA